jgi:hypothetical protein
MRLSDKIRLRYYQWKWTRQYRQAFRWLTKSQRDLSRTNPTLAGVTRSKVVQVLTAQPMPITIVEANRRTAEAIQITLEALKQELKRQSRGA